MKSSLVHFSESVLVLVGASVCASAPAWDSAPVAPANAGSGTAKVTTNRSESKIFFMSLSFFSIKFEMNIRCIYVILSVHFTMYRTSLLSACINIQIEVLYISRGSIDNTYSLLSWDEEAILNAIITNIFYLTAGICVCFLYIYIFG